MIRRRLTMLLANPAALMAFDSRVDVVARTGDGPIYRTASYDNGQNWQQPWKKVADPPLPGFADSLQQQDYGLAYAASGDGRVVHLCTRSSLPLNPPANNRIYHRRSDNFTRDWIGW